MRHTLPAIAGLLLLATACQPPPADDWHHEQWRAWLDSPGGELPFGLELRETPGGFEATLINGTERLPVTTVERNATTLTLGIEPYDSMIEASFGEDGHRLDGRWAKTGVAGAKTGLDFHAVAGELPRFASGASQPDSAALELLSGRWAVDFEKDDGPAIGIFEAATDGTVLATFMTTTGDYRYLAGRFEDDRLRLSVFDGAHAFLFDARLRDDGTLEGDFWSRDSWHESWTARKDPGAALPDAFGLTQWVAGETLGDVAYPDLDGRTRKLDDPAFAGRARILEVFGSWCPNCNDATRFLVELDREYRDHGLSIVGLAFEMSGDFDRDAEQVRVYARHHGIEYPLLVAGVSPKDEASEVFPLVDRVRSYPTTIFLHGDGRVRAVHQGYTGPATGEAHRELRERFESLVQELLAESHAPS